MDLLTAILACSLYPSDDALVRAIAQSNSHGNEFAVIDAASVDSDDARQPEPKTLAAAMARLGEVQSKDGKPLLGWMQLPPAWVTMFGRELRGAFDPCINISIGTAMLSAMDYDCSTETAPKPRAPRKRGTARSSVDPLDDRRACIIRRYSEAIGAADLPTVIQLELRYQRRVENGVPDARGFSGDSNPDWGANRIFFPVGSRPAPGDKGPEAHGGVE
jgi:hypothetical protein